MATASHAKGNIPMAMQRMGVPGAIAKDVGLFLKWIRNVSEEELATVKNADGDGAGAVHSGSLEGSMSASGNVSLQSGQVGSQRA